MRVVILAGPPCAGKTTLAYRIAQPDDVVLDYDEVARDLGSPVHWQHPEPWRTRAEHEMQARIHRAYTHPSEGRALVIRTAPRPAQRESLTAQWNAVVYLLDPGEQVCRQRALSRPSGTARAVGQWYHRYSPWHGDLDPVGLDPGWVGVEAVVRGSVEVDLRSI